MLLEKEMNEIKKKLEQKQKKKQKRDKESEKAANDYMKLRNKILKENYHNIFQKQVPKEKIQLVLKVMEIMRKLIILQIMIFVLNF